MAILESQMKNKLTSFHGVATVKTYNATKYLLIFHFTHNDSERKSREVTFYF